MNLSESTCLSSRGEKVKKTKSTLPPFLLSWAGRSEPDDLFEITNQLYCLYF